MSSTPGVPGSLSRESVLKRIRAGNGIATLREAALSDWAAIPRAYRRTAAVGVGREGLLDLLEDRLRDYDAHVMRSTPQNVAATVGEMLTKRGRVKMLIPSGVQQTWLPDGFNFVVDEALSALAIDKFEGVLTESTIAIAETGTIILQTAPGQGRRALSLVPDYHLCLVRASQVVATVPEAMDVLARVPAFGTTFISGPSATADIEMTRIKGVHGPRFLDVLLVLDE